MKLREIMELANVPMNGSVLELDPKKRYLVMLKRDIDSANLERIAACWEELMGPEPTAIFVDEGVLKVFELVPED